MNNLSPLSSVKTLSVLGLIFLTIPLSISAEITSGACPYSCSTQGIDKAQCKDWRKDDLCYVEDLRPAKLVNQNRKIVLVDQKIKAGETIKVDLPKGDYKIAELDAVVSRKGKNTDTTLTAKLGNQTNYGTLQVDDNDQHVLKFKSEAEKPGDRRLMLTAGNGTVYVESIHIILK